MTGIVAGNALPSIKGYESGMVLGSFSYQIRRGVEFSSSAVYAYVKRNINFPGTPDFSNPVATNLLSGYAGGSYQFSMGIKLKLDRGKGGSLLGTDRRIPQSPIQISY